MSGILRGPYTPHDDAPVLIDVEAAKTLLRAQGAVALSTEYACELLDEIAERGTA
jgi:hypothetical protein